MRQPLTATARAVDLLSRRDHARADLRRKLLARGHEPDEVDEALRRVEELGLHDEVRACESLARFYATHRGYGPLKVRGRLAQMGFAKDLVDRCVDRVDVDWSVSCRNVAAKKAHKGRAAVMRFLVSRGFPPSIARRTAHEVSEWDP